MQDFLIFGEEIGLTKWLTDDNEDFVKRESKSRYYTEQVLWSINPTLEFYQMPLYNEFDVKFESGDTLVKMESKVREYESGKYDDLRISGQKCDFDNCDDWWVMAYFNDDKKWYIWDLSKYKPRFVEKGWKHWKYTAHHPNNYIVVEDCWVFDFNKADRSGKIDKIHYGQAD